VNSRKPIRRASDPEAPAPYHKVRSLEVEGGFLDGVRLEFASQLNCVIGARGTGKTTVLELIRHALRDDARRARDGKLLKQNLGKDGVVKVGIETREGVRYVVHRPFDEPPQVRNEAGAVTEVSLAHGTVFDVDIYGQHEIEEIADDTAAQLRLIDRLIPPDELQTLELSLRALERQLDANAGDVRTLEGRRGALESGLSELPALKDKLEAHRPRGDDAAALRRELDLKGLRDREARSLSAVERFLRGGVDALVEAGKTIAGAAELVPGEIRGGPNGEAFDPLARGLQACRDEALERLREARAILERCGQRAADTRADIEARHRAQEAAFQALVGARERDQALANERDRVQRRVNELSDQERALLEVGAELERRLKERRGHMDQLVATRRRRFELRKAVAARLTEELENAGIQVTISQDGRSDRFKELLTGVFKGQLRNPTALAASLAGALLPQRLAELVQGRQTDRLAEAAGVTEGVAEQVVDLLAGSAELFKIEVAELEDEPTILMTDGDTEKNVSALSTGQKCTAILPILLVESAKPLLVDQPEDHLDNRFLYDKVVTKIRDVKHRRQLIFVTHNPNLPVGGVAERVFLLESDGKNGRLVAEGDVERMKKHVEAILEGGPEAFEERRRRYGH
jgi:ABC-type lipoprotein export system ATPase subunit